MADGADPVVVHHRHAVLGAARGEAEDLDRAQIGGDEGQARDPGRQRASGQEEVERRGDHPLQGEADAYDPDEEDQQEGDVDGCEIEPQADLSASFLGEDDHHASLPNGPRTAAEGAVRVDIENVRAARYRLSHSGVIWRKPRPRGP